jgi:hypothetical protein
VSNGWLNPNDFIDRAAVAEGWDGQDWAQWNALRARLEELGVTELRQHGPEILSAEHPGPFTSVRLDQGAGKPTLDAVLRLVYRVAPPEVPFQEGEEVIVALQGAPGVAEDEHAREEEPGRVLYFDIGTGNVTVQLTELPAGRDNIVTVPTDHVRRLQPG